MSRVLRVKEACENTYVTLVNAPHGGNELDAARSEMID
jgi:hypothetical protein